jgi:hypothetical protein
LEKIARRLIEKETIEREEFEDLIGRKKTPTKKADTKAKSLPKRREALKVKIRQV